MKNYVKEGQKLPIFGVGPYLVVGMGIVTAIGVILSAYILKIGNLGGFWVPAFRIVGVLLITIGIAVWFIGAVRSDMDASITENRLKTDGIYAWVRNPMYSGWWLVFAGITLMWYNAWTLLTIPVNWAIMTVVLRCTEEKWLLDTYGQAYADYVKRVNRCIPWIPGKPERRC